MKLISSLGLIAFSILSPIANAIPAASNFAQYFSQSLTVDGTVLSFSVSNETTSTNQSTVYGVADVTTITSHASDVIRTTTIYKIRAFSNTYLIQHNYSSSAIHIINQENAFAIDEGNAQSLRLFYGPADNTAYMDEDYMNFPAISGYSKQGRLLQGGMPLNYAWNRSQGFSLGVLSDKPSTAELPLSVTGSTLHMGVTYTPKPALHQQLSFGGAQNHLSPMVFFSLNSGDYYQALDQYAKLLEKITGRTIQNAAVDLKFSAPYWKTWGLDPNASGAFTKNDIWDIAEQLKALNIHWIMLDWGWFFTEGIWEANPDIFTDDADLANFITELKNDGFMVGVWYQPLQIDPTDSDVIAQLLPLAVRNTNGSPFIDDDDLALLNPALTIVQNNVLSHLNFFKDMGVEHVYIDSQIAQLAIPPDYPSASPLASHEALPDLYTLIRDFGNQNNIGIEICPDGRSHSILNMPQTITNIGDPKNDRQLRSEFKSLKAIQGSKAIIGTYVDPFEDNQVSGSFLNIIGIGGQLMTMFRSTNDLGASNWQQWTRFNTQKKLVRGAYQNVYDIGFDYPETHLVNKGNTKYYSFFTQEDDIDICMQSQCDEDNLTQVESGKSSDYTGQLVFKGLVPYREYTAVTFPQGVQHQFTANGAGRAVLSNYSFTKEILFEVNIVPRDVFIGSVVPPIYLLLLD